MRKSIFFAGFVLLCATARAQSYPLDPLTPAEITKAVAILKTDGHLLTIP